MVHGNVGQIQVADPQCAPFLPMAEAFGFQFFFIEVNSLVLAPSFLGFVLLQKPPQSSLVLPHKFSRHTQKVYFSLRFKLEQRPC